MMSTDQSLIEDPDKIKVVKEFYGMKLDCIRCGSAYLWGQDENDPAKLVI